MSSIKNTTNLYSLLLNTIQQKGLKMQLNKLDLHNRLILTLNKKIEKFPHNKINNKLGSSLNQNIVFNFNNKNSNTRRLINNKTLIIRSPSILTTGKIIKRENSIKLLKNKIKDLGQEAQSCPTWAGRAQIQNTTRLSITNNVIKIITSFFNGLGCLIARPQFIYKTDKLIIRIFYYQNNFNNYPLFSNNKSNFIYKLFNGTGLAKAQNSAPKSQNFTTILRNMLGQTKWNKVAQTIFNNKTINTLELANISKKVFIFFIKDLIHLTSYNKSLSIEKALTQLQKGASGLNSIFVDTPYHINRNRAQAGQGIRAGQFLQISRRSLLSKRTNKKIGIIKNNQLLINLISSTKSESLIKNRTRLSKTFFNKTLLAKLIKKVNNHNNNINLLLHKAENLGSKKNILPNELIGKGLLLNPINKKKLNALLAWLNIDLSEDYKTIATALLLLIKNNNINNINNIKNTLNGSRLQDILSNKINQNLKSLSTQFADEASKNINFIIKKTQPTFLIGTSVNTKITKITKITNSTLLPIRARFNKGIMLGPKIINLINKQFGLEYIDLPSLVQKPKNNDKLLTLIKESIKAYNYGLNGNKNNFIPSNIFSMENNVKKFKLLGSLLTKIFKKNIEIQMVKLHNIGLQENVLAKVISENAKFDKSSVLIKKLLKKIAISKASLIQFNKQNKILNNNDLIYNSNLHNTIFPEGSVPILTNLKIKEQGVKLINTMSKEKNNINFDQLYDQIKNVNILHTNPLVLGKVVGLNIKIAGRLQKEPIRPKQTVKTLTIGSLSKERSNTTNISSLTSKNKKGSFRITVKMAHIRTFSSF
jgi:Mitochondrial ribosomal protein (VAR1)